MTARRPTSINAQVTHDLNEILGALRDHPALARALTDPSAPREARAMLIDGVFPGVVDEARTVLKQALETSWESSKELANWVETTVVRAAWTWADQEGVLERSIEEVFSFGQLVFCNHEVRAAVTDRRVGMKQRQELVKSLLSETMVEPSIEIAMVAAASRQGTIDDAVRSFVQMGADHAGGHLAVVTVAKPMASGQKDRIGAALETRLKVKIIIQEIVDPLVLGGVRVECGAEVIDSTMASRLETVRRNFA